MPTHSIVKSQRIITLTRQGEFIYYSGTNTFEPRYCGRTVEEALSKAKSRRIFKPERGDLINDLTAKDPHNSVEPEVGEDGVPLGPSHAQRVAKAKCYHDSIPNLPNGPMAYEWRLAVPSGARFWLLPEKKHTKKEVDEAARFILMNRDVVGRVRVLRASNKAGEVHL